MFQPNPSSRRLLTEISVSIAAIHSTTITVTAIIYDLAAHPEYIQPLQDEIQQIINEDGQDVDGNGFMHLKKGSMSKLWKLDSFMKESQRLTPTHLRMLSRTSLKTPFPDNQHSNQPPRHNRTSHPLNRPHPPNRNTIWLCCICHSPFPNLLELRDLQTCYRIRRFPLLQPTQNPRKREQAPIRRNLIRFIEFRAWKSCVSWQILCQ